MIDFLPDTKRFPTRFDGDDGGYQVQMRDAFIEQARQALQTYRPRDATVLQIGLEMELSIVSADLSPAPQALRDEAVQALLGDGTDHATFVTQELGASQIEVVTEPRDILRESSLLVLQEMREKEKRLSDWLLARNAHLLRIGAVPNERIGDIQVTQGHEKYQKCPTFHTRHQRPGLDRFIGSTRAIDVSNTFLPGITNSIQLNMDCATAEEAIDILNRALVVAPIATLLGANAGFIDEADSGCADIRYLAWAISHDIRSWEEVSRNSPQRVGLPHRYYNSIDDYLSSVLSIPFFMSSEQAFRLGIGTYWRDVRLKFLTKPDGLQLVTEFRPVSTQPTPEDDFALMMFYVGRVHYSRQNAELIPPFECVRANKDLVMRCGRRAPLYFLVDGTVRTMEFDEFMPTEIMKAINGLEKLQIERRSVEFVNEKLQERLRTSLPVDAFRAHFDSATSRGALARTAINEAILSGGLISG